jgi:integrase
MTINRSCPICKSTFKLDTLNCSRCPTRPWLTRFKVRVRHGKHWKTLLTSDLRTAQEFQEAALREAQATASAKKARRSTSSPQLKAPAIGAAAPSFINAAPSLAEVFDLYITQAQQRGKRSWSSDVGRMENYLSALASLPLGDITPELVQQTLDGMRPHPKFKNRTKGLSAATRRQAFALLSILFRWAIRKRLWAGNSPMAFVDSIPVRNERLRYLSHEELRRLLDAIEAEPHEVGKLAVSLLLFTGCRRSEVLAIEWGDADLERGILTFRQTKNGRIRSIPVSAPALEVLRKARDHVSGPLHPLSPGRVCPLTISQFQTVWMRIRKRSQLVNFRCHDMRHAFASIAASSGKVDLYTLQTLLGHRSITQTQRYAHLMPGPLLAAANAVGDVFSSAG